MKDTTVLGIGTALPDHVVTRVDVQAWMARALTGHPEAARFARRVIDRSGVERRRSCVADFTAAGEPRLLGERSPGTAARMRAFAEHAPTLAALACRRALDAAGTDADEIAHLVLVTCTGFIAPGPDVELIELLGLRPEVERTQVGFMGCCAAFNGLRVGRQSVTAQPGTKALVVCVELCSLHFRPDPSPDSVVAHALFGDGAAAVVLGEGEGIAHLARSATRVEPGTRADMGWTIGDDGFRMALSSYVPQLVGAELSGFVAPLAGHATESWCVHPGGRAILDHVQDALALPPAALASSREVLRDPGNLSSATVLFVLERELARLAGGARGVMLGFGPGLTLEGLAFERGARPLLPVDEAVRGVAQ